jgi:hypothetical protein
LRLPQITQAPTRSFDAITALVRLDVANAATDSCSSALGGGRHFVGKLATKKS